MDLGPANDPLRDSFREWTDEEKAALSDDALDRHYPRCPVDETRLEVNESTFGGGKTVVHLRCKRCRQHHEETFPRE